MQETGPPGPDIPAPGCRSFLTTMTSLSPPPPPPPLLPLSFATTTTTTSTTTTTTTTTTSATTTTTTTATLARGTYLFLLVFARRSNTFRLAKPTLMPLLLATGPSGPGLVPPLPLPGIGPAHDSPVSPKLPAATAADASPRRTGVALRSLAINTTGSHGAGPAARTRSQTSTGGTVTGAARTVPSVSVVRAAFSTPSVAGERIARNLIGEYLAAKRTRSDAQQQQQQQQQAQQQLPIPPPIFHVHQSPSAGHLVNRQRCERQNEELAYKHPRLLMTDAADDEEADEASCGASDSCSAGGYGVGESEDDCSIELVLQDDTNGHDDDDGGGEEETSVANESLIVPRPKMIAFHSLKGGKERQQQQQQQRPVCSPPASSACRLVGKVNPNILKTWEQLSGGGQQYNACMHQQPKRRSASAGRILLLAEECSVGGTTGEQSATPPHPLRAATSTSGYLHFDTGGGEEPEASDDGESADERQSCLLYCPQQRPYHHGDEGEKEAEEEVIEFKVNKLQHRHPAVSSAVPSSGTSAGAATTTTVGSTSSEGADFYDSIDAVSTCVREASAAPRPGHGAFLPGGGGDDDDDNEDDGGRIADGNYTDLPSVAGGEGLAEFTSIDRKQLLWSIEIGEQQ
uniref:Uncharacterized protein n=1 Tax=Anopheles atroparvus TaxID=41427 RepID=A0AAG5DY11_ANOAO